MPGYVPPVDASSAGDDGGGLSGLAGIFSTIGTAVTQVYSTVNKPAPVVAAPGSGAPLVYNPQTGTYGPPVSSLGANLGGNTGTILIFLGIGLGVILLLRH